MKMSASLPVFNVPHLVQIGSGAASSSSINKLKHTFIESNFSPATLQVVFKRCSRTTLYKKILSFEQFLASRGGRRIKKNQARSNVLLLMWSNLILNVWPH